MRSYEPGTRSPGTVPGRIAIVSLVLMGTGFLGAAMIPAASLLAVAGTLLLVLAYTLYAVNIFSVGGLYRAGAVLLIAFPVLAANYVQGLTPPGLAEFLGITLGVLIFSLVLLWGLAWIERGIFRRGQIQGAPNPGFMALSALGMWLFMSVLLGASLSGSTLHPSWITDTGTVSPTVTQTTVIPTYPRPATGTFFTGRYESGSFGNIKLDNLQGPADAVVALISRDRKIPDIAVYVRRGEIFTVTNVLSSTYDVYVTRGENWDNSAKRFTINPVYFRFTSPVKFTAYGKVEGAYDVTHYWDWSITLLPGGESSSEVEFIDGQAFPAL